MSWNCAMPRTLIAAVSICLLASAAMPAIRATPPNPAMADTLEMV
jgi:hypothetical protein